LTISSLQFTHHYSSGRDFVGFSDGKASECGYNMAADTVVWGYDW